MSELNKEEIYDTQISLLMSKVLDICRENKIAMLASFSIPTPDDQDLSCTSALLGDEYNPPEPLLKACKVIMPTEHLPMFITIERGDGSKDITAVLG